VLQVDRFVSGRGYVRLDDYTPEAGSADASGAIPLVSLRSRSASLVLGEPGAGKSTALRRLRSVLIEEGTVVHLVDLKDCHSDLSLERAFDQIDTHHRDHEGRGVLLIDSVDEAPGLIRNYVRFLENRLSVLIDGGWNIIAVCRTAETVRALDDLFENLQRDAIHVLLPLRRSDIKAIAESEGIDATEFAEQVRRRRLDSLAAIPFTLNLLCRVYQVDSAFPASREEVFERAVALITAEESVDGYTPDQNGNFEPIRQRLAAERLAGFAAICELSGFGLFHVGESSAGEPTETVIGEETYDGLSFDLENHDFQRLLRTPLFADSGPNERQFAHRRLRDFLAARFITRQRLDLSQVRSIIVVTDGEMTVPPQMVDIATWLVALRPDEFDWLISADPFSLVRNRIADDLPQLSARLVGEMLDRAPEIDQLLSWRDDLSGLEHENLTAQIGRGLAESEQTQVLALRILRDSYVVGLEDALADCVEDQARSIRVRKLAIEVLSQREVEDRLARIQPLHDGFFDSDAYAELRGAVLEAMWPEHLTISQLLALLIRPPDNFIGGYTLFLQRLERDLSPELARALVNWGSLAAQATEVAGAPRRSGRHLRALVDKAIEILAASSALTAIDESAIATILIERLQRDRDKLPIDRSRMPPASFRRLISAVVSSRSDDNFAWYSLLRASDARGDRLLGRDDLDWTSERALAVSESPEFLTWMELIDRLLDSSKPADQLWAWEQRGGPLWSGLRYRFDPVELNSDFARRSAESWRAMNRADEDTDQHGMSADEYLSTLHRLLESTREQPHQFWNLSRWLDVDFGAGRYNHSFEPDLLRLPGVDLLGDGAASTVLRLADSYLRSDPPLPSRLRRNTVYYHLRAAYQALHTLAVHEPQTLDHISPQAWGALSTAMLEFPLGGGGESEHAVRVGLLNRAQARTPEGFDAAVSAFLRRLADGRGESSSIADLKGLTGQTSPPLLRRAIRNKEVFDRHQVFQLYLETAATDASGWARRRLASSTDVTEMAILLGSLLEHEASSGFSLLTELLAERGDLASAVILEVASRERYGQNRMHQVEPHVRIQIFELLVDLFPPSQESFETGVHAVTPREDLAEWRQGLLNSVVRAGTREGMLSVIDLSQRRPDLHLEWAVASARESFRVNGWLPLSVAELRLVLARSGARLARSNSDVLSLVVDALDEIQEWLTGETPQAFALWDVGPGFRSPKDENRISDWYCHALRIVLDRAGLIINREVEVRNTSGRGVGHRQDVRIEVRDRTNGEHYVTVVEVKGIWNSGVRTNLMSQLVDDYLVRGGLTHGIYLVAMFSPSSMVGVPSKQAASRRNVRGLRETLDNQATSVAPALSVVAILHDADMPA
jgi:hypothetical protein